MVPGSRISVLLIIIFILSLGLIITLTPRTEAIYKTNSYLYPNIIQVLDNVSTIDITNNSKKLSFKKNNDEVWEIINDGNFPAQMNLVNDLLLGVAYLKIIEQKTADPNLYSLLHVDDIKAENPDTIAVTLKDPANKYLVNLLVGKREQQAIIGSPAKTEQLYVRKAGDRQSWLVEGTIPISLEFKDWVNQPLLPINANDIRKIAISNNYSKTPMVIFKENADGNFYIKDNNRKQSITTIQADNNLVHMLSHLEYHNATLYNNVAHNWRPNLKIDIDIVNNFKLHIELAKIKQRICARVFTISSVDAQGSDGDPSNKLNKVNEISKMWVFQVSDDIYNLVNKSQLELINALNGVEQVS